MKSCFNSSDVLTEKTITGKYIFVWTSIDSSNRILKIKVVVIKCYFLQSIAIYGSYCSAVFELCLLSLLIIFFFL